MVRILADQATVRIAGDVLADGGVSSVGGGAGGAIEIIADRLEGTGAICARGGDRGAPQRLGRTEAVGEEGREGPGAPIEAPVAADDEVGAGKRLKVWLNRMLPIEPVL